MTPTLTADTTFTTEQIERAARLWHLSPKQMTDEDNAVETALMAELGEDRFDDLNHLEEVERLADELKAGRTPKRKRKGSVDGDFPIIGKNRVIAPRRKEDWVELTEYDGEPLEGFMMSGAGEVMAPDGKVRKIENAFNVKTRHWSHRVWLGEGLGHRNKKGEKTGYAYHNRLLIERHKVCSKLKARAL
jgi:hypothetical protein